MSTTALEVFFFALITAVATGLGAIPFLFFKKITINWLGISNAIAAGLMLTASFTLIFEGMAYGLWKTMLGIFAGLIFILISNKFLSQRDDLQLSNLNGVDAKKAILLLGVMTLHSFTEGVGVGVSFGGGEDLGIFITAAIALHNIPEGLAICLTLIPRGMKIWKASLWCVFTSLPQPIMAIPAFVFVEVFNPFLPVGLGFAAGAMIWMVFSEILPEAEGKTDSNTIGVVITLSIMAMFIFQYYLR